MSFYNPYMQHPDWAGGAEDFMQQMFQMMMYKKYMDGMDGEQGQGKSAGSGPDEGLYKQLVGDGVAGVPQGTPDRGPMLNAIRQPSLPYAPPLPQRQGPANMFPGRGGSGGGLGMQFPQMPQGQPQQSSQFPQPPGGSLQMPQQQADNQQQGGGIQGLLMMLMQNPEMLAALGL